MTVIVSTTVSSKKKTTRLRDDVRRGEHEHAVGDAEAVRHVGHTHGRGDVPVAPHAVLEGGGSGDGGGQQPDADGQRERRAAGGEQPATGDRTAALLGHRDYAVHGAGDAEDRQEVDELAEELG